MHAKIQIRRNSYTDTTTIGELYINGKFFCYTLEDVVRKKGIKIPRITAIPNTRYNVAVTWSPRFKRNMPLIYNVVDDQNRMLVEHKGVSYEGIRFHSGNTSEDSDACIIVGYNKVDANRIQGSAEADLTAELQKYDTVELNIVNMGSLLFDKTMKVTGVVLAVLIVVFSIHSIVFSEKQKVN